jgi:solute carrier family 25 (mitochondrial adenine nucleotide translocator), member 4/5/6/31
LNWTFKTLFEEQIRKLDVYTPTNNFLINYVGGALAGLTTRFLLYPLEFTKNKMNNIISRSKRGIIGHLRDALLKEGLRGIYRGATVSFAGVAIFRSTYFGIYDTFKEQTTN